MSEQFQNNMALEMFILDIILDSENDDFMEDTIHALYSSY